MENKKSFHNKFYKKSEKAKEQYKPKRGSLSKLMSEEEKQEASIHELSYDFACRITRLFQYLTENSEYKEFVQSKQITEAELQLGRMYARVGTHKVMRIFYPR